MRWLQGLATVAAASAASAAVIAVEAAFSGLFRAGGMFVSAPLASTAGFLIVAMLPVVAIILPAFAVLSRTGRLRLWTALATGVVAGLVLTAVIAALLLTVLHSPPAHLWLSGARMMAVTVGSAMAGWGAWRAMQRRVKPEDTAEMF